MTVEIISWSISTKVWDRTGIELATPGSAVRHASVARHVTDCATWPGRTHLWHSHREAESIWRSQNAENIRTSKGDYWIKQWLSSIVFLFIMGTALKGKNLLPEREREQILSMENHFYHIRWPPLNVTIFITHVHNCLMGATPMACPQYIMVKHVLI